MKCFDAPPVPAQFFLSSELQTAPGLNTVAYAVRLLGSLDADRLESALRVLVSRHAALRSRFQLADAKVQVWVAEHSSRQVLEVRDTPPSEAALQEAVVALRGSLLPESLLWRALLLRHDAFDHTFVLTAHRCIWDEPSARTFGHELSEVYRERLGGSAAEQPAALETTTTPSKADSEAGANHFAAGLTGAPPIHEFPLLGRRPRVFPVAAAEVQVAVTQNAISLLPAFATAIGLEPFDVVVAAASCVFARYCRHSTVALGFPFDLRGLGGEIGSNSATLPIGFDVSDGVDFASFCRAFAARLQDGRRYAKTPFEAILKARRAHAEPSANPLFQLACAQATELRLDLDACACSPRSVPTAPQQVDLFLEIGGDRIIVAYASELISGDVAASFARSIGVLLDAALSDPSRGLTRLPLLDEVEHRRIAFELNQTARPEFKECDLFALITRHFHGDSAKPALISNGRARSYAELAEDVERISRRLASVDVSTGALVGICLPRSTDMVAAMLAVLRAGAAYVPLDPTFPRDRLKYMVEHSRLRHVITTSELQGSFDRGPCFLELDCEPATAVDALPPLAAVSGNATAYVIYTSGSTGRPKGVAIPRAAAANFLSSMLVRPGISSTDVLCAITTLSFDIAVLELLAPLAAGGTVIIASEEEAKDPRLLAELLQTHSATVLQATPISWQMLCSGGWPGDPKLRALCGGEALTSALATALLPRVGELWNMYGPTETTVWSTCHRIEAAGRICVGTPIHNTTTYVCDDALELCPVGVEGRLFIGGGGVALGYLHDPELTAKRFVPDTVRGTGRMYDTGDRARLAPDGTLEIMGRSDFQVKLRGFRIELGEIESRLMSFSGVEQAVCLVERDDPANPELVAFYTLDAGVENPSIAALREHCAVILPSHMVPSRFGRLDAFPLTPNGKVDRNAFPKLAGAKTDGATARAVAMPRGDVERELVEIWSSVLGTPVSSVNDNFFDLGGTSMAAVLVVQEITRRLHTDISVLRIFEHATIAALAKFLKGAETESRGLRRAYAHAKARRDSMPSPAAFDIAIVGMAGRFPGARNLDELWQNLSQGRETITFFDRAELDPAVPAADRNDSSYIPARGILEESDHFDAAFFGISPNEAELMDPQLRVFLEVAWEAFEHAGYVGEQIDGEVGVWGGMGNNFYYLYNVLTRPDKLAVMGEIAAEIANEKDHIAPRVSYKLNLTGPSLSVHTACSTTLVVIENAFQALISRQVDVALAGGVDVRTPQKSGQRYEDGGVFSIDGRCRPFDAEATGTMFGEGVGAVVLKRYEDAVRDGDTVYALIKGAAINHDGGKKVSYLAPSVEGQASVVAATLGIAGVDPSTITYVEAHGTATPIGDPIEVEALTRVYRTFTQRRRYCAIGSIKGNFGHATTAAGIAGLLKVVLSMRNRKIAPTLHFKTPNPRIDFASSPFFVADKLLDWNPPGIPRRASVSSFGFCGTNAHVILEEAPAIGASSEPARPYELLLLSARNKAALDAGAERLGAALRGSSPVALADAAFTTHVGRKRLEHRRCLVVGNSDEVATHAGQAAGGRVASLTSERDGSEVAFLFPGQGAQYVNMGLSLYETEPVFRQAVDRCVEGLAPHLGLDLRKFLFPAPDDAETARQSLNLTFYTQPAIFTISYSIAALFQHWGIQPAAFIGHSIGEFVAATLSEVMTLDDALMLVATRGRLMRSLTPGSMLSVRMPSEALVGSLPAGVDLAAINSPQLCVVAGPTPVLEQYQAELSRKEVACRMLHTSHAFHSSMMDEIVEPFQKCVERVALSAPRIPFVSTVTGEWVTAADVTTPTYWARHLRSPVLFSNAVRRLLEDSQRVLLECGPRRTCTSLALQQRPENPARVLGTMPDSAEPNDECPSMLLALGTLWLNGCNPDWSRFHDREQRRRVALPTYAFQRQRYWIDPGSLTSFGLSDAPTEATRAPVVLPAQAVAVSGSTGAHSSANDAVVGDPLESAVIQLLEEALGAKIDPFDADGGFIALGLDSLLLTQLARMVRVRFGFNVTFRQLTESYSTPRRLMDAIRNGGGAAAAAWTDAPEVGSVPNRATSSSEKPAASTRQSVSGAQFAKAKLGRDTKGHAAWFIPDPSRTGGYLQVSHD